MALYQIPSNLGLGGGEGLHGDEVLQLAKALTELQRSSTTVATGAAASTPIPVTGLAADDTLQSVLAYNAGVPTDVTADCTIDVNGDLVCTDDTTGMQLVVAWWAKAPA